MQLYTINSTPVQAKLTDEENILRVEKYSQEVAKFLGEYGINGFTAYDGEMLERYTEKLSVAASFGNGEVIYASEGE